MASGEKPARMTAATENLVRLHEELNGMRNRLEQESQAHQETRENLRQVQSSMNGLTAKLDAVARELQANSHMSMVGSGSRHAAEWDIILGPLIGVGIGGLLSYLFTIDVNRRYRNQEGKNVASAFAGEISAILESAKHREYVRGLQLLIDHVEQTGQPVSLGLNAQHDYFVVYKANATRLGMLRDPLPRLISGFYTHTFLMLEDARELSSPGFKFENAQDCIARLSELLALFQANERMGEEVLTAISPPSATRRDT